MACLLSDARRHGESSRRDSPAERRRSRSRSRSPRAPEPDDRKEGRADSHRCVPHGRGRTPLLPSLLPFAGIRVVAQALTLVFGPNGLIAERRQSLVRSDNLFPWRCALALACRAGATREGSGTAGTTAGGAEGQGTMTGAAGVRESGSLGGGSTSGRWCCRTSRLRRRRCST
jgi:hypothetical protein